MPRVNRHKDSKWTEESRRAQSKKLKEAHARRKLAIAQGKDPNDWKKVRLAEEVDGRQILTYEEAMDEKRKQTGKRFKRLKTADKGVQPLVPPEPAPEFRGNEVVIDSFQNEGMTLEKTSGRTYLDLVPPHMRGKPAMATVEPVTPQVPQEDEIDDEDFEEDIPDEFQEDFDRESVDHLETLPKETVEVEAPIIKSEAKPKPVVRKTEKIVDKVIERKEEFAPTWQGRDVSILMPIYLHTNGATLFSLMAAALDCGKEGIRFDCEMGDSMVYHSRNMLADRFLQTGATWSLWLDSDVVAPIGRPALIRKICGLPDSYPEAALEMHFIHRLLGHNKKFVGATYYGRQRSGKPMFREAIVDHEANEAARRIVDGIRPTSGVGTGCLLVHRDVYLAIQNKFPELAPTQDRPYWDYFLPMSGIGEDIAFCMRAKEAGMQPHVDTGLQCFHVGYCAWGQHNTVGGAILQDIRF